MNTWPRPPAIHGLLTARTIQTKKMPLIVTTATSSHRYRSYRSARVRFPDFERVRELVVDGQGHPPREGVSAKSVRDQRGQPHVVRQRGAIVDPQGVGVELPIGVGARHPDAQRHDDGGGDQPAHEQVLVGAGEASAANQIGAGHGQPSHHDEDGKDPEKSRVDDRCAAQLDPRMVQAGGGLWSCCMPSQYALSAMMRKNVTSDLKALHRSGEKRSAHRSGCSSTSPSGTRKLSAPRLRILFPGLRTSPVMSRRKVWPVAACFLATVPSWSCATAVQR